MDGEPAASKRAVVRQWIKDEWGTPVLIAGTALSSLSQAFDGKTLKWTLGIGVALGIVGGIVSVVQSRRTAQLRRSLRKAEADKASAQDDLATIAQMSKHVYRSLLSQLAEELQLGTQGRITVYCHIAERSAFQKVCRHSKNRALEQAPGRVAFKDEHGVIGMAWREVEVIEPGLPDPVSDAANYEATNYRKYGLPTEVTRRLSMKSRVLVGLRFPPEDHGQEPIGVLLVESLDDSLDAQRVLAQVKLSAWWRTLQAHLRAQGPQLPVLTTASEKGF